MNCWNRIIQNNPMKLRDEAQQMTSRLSRYLALAARMVLLSVASVCLAADAEVDLSTAKSLSPEQAAALQGKVVYLDVRSGFEWWQGHVKGAIHIPHGEVADTVTSVLPDRTKPIVTYCAVGGRASRVVADMKALGYTVVPVVGGGFTELVDAGLPEAE
jgi:rhodanese-related sulfurtransferase